MSFELVETDCETGRKHIWFQLHSKEEAIEIMLKRCFGEHSVFDIYKHQNDWTGCDIYDAKNSHMTLFQRYKLRDIYDFDDTRGPSTEFVYEIQTY